MESLKEEIRKCIFEGRPTGKTFTEVEPVKLTFEENFTDIYWNTMNEYSFEAIFGRKAVCRNSKEADQMKKRIYEEVIEHIYGDLRRRLYRLYSPISYGDKKTVLDELDKIMKDMAP